GGSWGTGLIRGGDDVGARWDKSSPGGECLQEILPGFLVVHAISRPRGSDLFFAMFSSGTSAQHQLAYLNTESNHLECLDSTLAGTLPHAVEIFADTLVGVASDRGVTFL